MWIGIEEPRVLITGWQMPSSDRGGDRGRRKKVFHDVLGLAA